jgi:recombinational DNA repair protein (RecF pathway)
MTQDPHDDVTACAVCGLPVEPYGILRHIFASEDAGVICTACARTVAPDQVEMADALEAAARSRGLGES